MNQSTVMHWSMSLWRAEVAWTPCAQVRRIASHKTGMRVVKSCTYVPVHGGSAAAGGGGGGGASSVRGTRLGVYLLARLSLAKYVPSWAHGLLDMEKFILDTTTWDEYPVVRGAGRGACAFSVCLCVCLCAPSCVVSYRLHLIC